MKKIYSRQLSLLTVLSLLSFFSAGQPVIANSGEAFSAGYTTNVASILTRKNFFDCQVPRVQISIGYSHLSPGVRGVKTKFPVGADLGVSYRLDKNLQFVVNTSGHSSKKFNANLFRIYGHGGFRFMRENCNRQRKLSFYTKATFGFMHESFKQSEGSRSNSNAPAANAGGGLDISVAPRAGICLSGDYLIAFVKGNPQHNARFGIGLNLDIGKSQ